MEDEVILTAKNFALKNSTNEIVWYVQPDGEYLEWDEDEGDEETWIKDIELSDETHQNAVYFDNPPLYCRRTKTNR